MALIKISDLMVVQKMDGVENPVVSFTIDDLHKSLAEFDDKVSKTGDVMTGQLQLRKLKNNLVGNINCYLRGQKVVFLKQQLT